MQSQAPAGPSRETGLPPGVEVGPLGARVAAYLIDAVVPAVLGVILSFLAPGLSGGGRVVLSTVLVLLILGWAVLVLVMIATRAASPGMRAMKLQLVGFYDGRPIGLPRALLRGLVFWALSVTGVGLVIMLVLLVIHPRRQGWHDRLAEAVVIKARMLAPPPSAAVASAPSSVSPASPPDASDQYGPQYARPPAQQEPPPEQYRQEQYPAEQQSSGPQSRGQQYVAQHSPLLYAPGQPAPAPAPSPPVLAAVPAPEPDPTASPDSQSDSESDGESDGDETRLHVPARSSGWVAVLDDGRRLAVDGLVLLGRNPQPQPGEEDADLVKLADETRTVSKSHLAIGLDAAGIYVVDRGSTNGSTVTNAGGVSTRCRVSEPVYVGEDSIVSMGDHWLRIERTES